MVLTVLSDPSPTPIVGLPDSAFCPWYHAPLQLMECWSPQRTQLQAHSTLRQVTLKHDQDSHFFVHQNHLECLAKQIAGFHRSEAVHENLHF